MVVNDIPIAIECNSLALSFIPVSDETLPNTPPKYNDTALDSPINTSSSTPTTTSVPLLPNVTYEENEYGEMQPTQSDAVRARIPSGTTFQENEYGEIHRAETDPDLTDNAQNVTATSEPKSDHFGEDTTEKAIEYRSDDVYAENRYGELGRADTYYGSSANLSDKIKGEYCLLLRETLSTRTD